MNIRKNISLIVGIAIPILMVILVALSIYVPRYFAPKPAYDFVYTTGADYYSSKYNYAIEGDRIIRTENPPIDNGMLKPPILSMPMQTEQKLYYYDIKADQARELSFEEAQSLRLDSNNKSPDGFEIVYGNYASGPFFGSGGDYNSRYIKGHNLSRKLNLSLSGNYYDFRFLGWVKK